MKVNLFVSKDLEEPYAEIYTDALTDNIQKAMVLLENEDEYEEEGIGDNSILAVKKGQDIVLLDFEDIFMIRVEEKQTKVYTENKDYLFKDNYCQFEKDKKSGSFLKGNDVY